MKADQVYKKVKDNLETKLIIKNEKLRETHLKHKQVTENVKSQIKISRALNIENRSKKSAIEMAKKDGTYYEALAHLRGKNRYYVGSNHFQVNMTKAIDTINRLGLSYNNVIKKAVQPRDDYNDTFVYDMY